MGGTRVSSTPIIIGNTTDDPLSTQTTFDTVIQDIVPGLAKNANENWFDTPNEFETINDGRGAICRIDFSFSLNDARISFTYDGIEFFFLAEGTVLKAGSLYSFKTGVEANADFNMRSDQDIVIERCVTVVEGKQQTS